MGKNHHRTADLCHKVAQHLIRTERYEEALLVVLPLPLVHKVVKHDPSLNLDHRNHVDRALVIWEYDPNVYKPEIARTSFLKAWLLEELGMDLKARVLYKRAYALRRELVPALGKSDAELDDDDFDALVTFWSK